MYKRQLFSPPDSPVIAVYHLSLYEAIVQLSQIIWRGEEDLSETLNQRTKLYRSYQMCIRDSLILETDMEDGEDRLTEEK